MSFKIGIDVGGTFTDLLVFDDAGNTSICKAPTTPADPSQGVFAALQQAASERNLPTRGFLEQVESIVHGTTITTNAVLTASGARTAFITTHGFRDLLNLRRGMKDGERYDLQLAPPPQLIERSLNLTVRERVNARGEQTIPLHEEDVASAAAVMQSANIEAIAISYLWSFLNPEHELRTRELLEKEFPNVYISLSCEVLPQIRVYERHSTTALNSYCGPPLASYLQELEQSLQQNGFSGTLNIMQSNGGCMSPKVTSRFSVNTLLSGPAGGPGAGIHYGKTHDYKNIITVDMGGTSFDVALVQNETPVVSSENEVGGFHVAVPMLDIHTVGAGGGSIAGVDSGGMLYVGPASAGADPGPACYDRGGSEPTVTDADLILGYLDADYFHGGAMTLNREAASRAIEKKVAIPLGLSITEAADGIYRVANSIMSGAVTVVTVQRGLDPREFAMIVAGGAGPIHAVPIARELGIRTLLVPRESSVFCAAGMLLSDLKHTYVRTCAMLGSLVDFKLIGKRLQEMRDLALSTFADENLTSEDVTMQYSADLRYVGQFNEVEVTGFNLGDSNEQVWQQLIDDFHGLHDERFGYALPQGEVELINLRLVASGKTGKPQASRFALKDEDAVHAIKGRREAWFDNSMQLVDVYDGLALQSGNLLLGPAIVEQPTTTIVLPTATELRCDEWGNYLIEILRKKEE
ncbi:MAG: hydantoinase/oxoprolinase family protein [Gammaproteobacteria bacterium]|nr:hydantoinase/oxoprolinase family protein [Gammaproteobacteria bacterium]